MTRQLLVLPRLNFGFPFFRSLRTGLSKAMIVALVVVGFSVLTSGQALASHVSCGDTIIRDTTLRVDLNCAGRGLIIGANNITLDLNGHTIAGTNTEGSIGIEAASRDGVIIRDGTIRHFETGLILFDTGNALLRRLTVTDIVTLGILLEGGHDNSIDANRVVRTGVDWAGIAVVQSNNNELSRNVLSRNGDGIMLLESNANSIRRNLSFNSGVGIGVLEHSGRNVVEHNVTNGNSDTGILLDRHADNNRIRHNFASGNAFAGIAVGASDHNLVSHNTTNRNPGGGIAIVDNAIGTLVEGNNANYNGGIPPGCVPLCPLLDDGIHVDSPATVLTRNTANHNHDLGIQAVPGVTDGGGNRARGNGNAAQCTNIECR